MGPVYPSLPSPKDILRANNKRNECTRFKPPGKLGRLGLDQGHFDPNPVEVHGAGEGRTRVVSKLVELLLLVITS